MSSLPASVRLVEVGPRDGLQNEKTVLPAAQKVELIERLADTGLRSVEATSFVSPQWVPQLADAAEVFAGIRRRPGVSYPVLVPNLKGYERARAVGAEEVAVFTAASEAFNRKNINASIEALSAKIESLVTNQASSSTTISNASATNLMGKYVRVSAKDVVYTAGQSSPIKLNVHTDAGQDSVLSILDKDGEIVNVLPMKGGIETDVSWDGTKMDGGKASTGTYSLKVTSKDGVTETGYAFFENKVTGINFAKGGTRLEINGQTVGMDQVVRVGDEPTTLTQE